MTAALNHLTSIQYDQHFECHSAVINMSANPLHLFFGRKEKNKSRQENKQEVIRVNISLFLMTLKRQKNVLFMDQLLKQTLHVRSPTAMSF